MQQMEATMIAPCGMNCQICVAHQRSRKPCSGCNGDDATKPNHCVHCVIRHCPNRTGFCYDCEKFPCKRMKDLDKRYRTKYGMSMLENLAYIQQNGLPAFLQMEGERRTCKQCGALLCIHRNECPSCKAPREI